MNNYYVYVCKVDGQIKYIGMGKGSRFKHCNSGRSSCVELNRDFFSGKHLDTEIVADELSKDGALHHEKFLIDEVGMDSLYNKNKGATANDLEKRCLDLLDEFYHVIVSQIEWKVRDVVKVAISLSHKYDKPLRGLCGEVFLVKLLPYFGYQKVKNRKVFVLHESVDIVDVMATLKKKMRGC